MATTKLTVYVDGEKRVLGHAEALTLLQAHQATIDPPAQTRTAADTRSVETAAAPAAPKPKKAPAAKKAPSKSKG